MPQLLLSPRVSPRVTKLKVSGVSWFVCTSNEQPKVKFDCFQNVIQTFWGCQMLHCFAVKPPAPEQSESGAAVQRKSKHVYDWLFFFFKETLDMPEGPQGLLHNLKPFYHWRHFSAVKQRLYYFALVFNAFFFLFHWILIFHNLSGLCQVDLIFGGWGEQEVLLIGWREITESRRKEVETGGDKDSHFCLSVNKDLEFNTVCEGWEVCE